MGQSRTFHAAIGSAVPTELSRLIEQLQDEHLELNECLSEMAVRAYCVMSEQESGLAAQELLRLELLTISFRNELERHAAWEENILFPFLSTYFDKSLKPSLLPSLWTLEKDHELGDSYLQSFLRSVHDAGTNFDRKRTRGAVDDLIQACYILSKHLEDEERWVFPLADSVLTDMDLLFAT
ncbi:hemerythrin domain-containing protein [Paenibacillus soyae]|uniref:Hemerythrin domain-containing protein n=1 Tax=Paenibacillus soyae TaxID=2969249 RepID=A0A9X2MNL8_9BACL|nr:hemerythrin domain-containing protein [Paenibacillus soyae]MCR2804054.1 hemerythrin domain-containing protein [Paenibacillus soyae]